MSEPCRRVSWQAGMRCLLQICCPSSLLCSHRQWSRELHTATQTLGRGSSPHLQTGESRLQASSWKHIARPASHVQQLLALLAPSWPG